MKSNNLSELSDLSGRNWSWVKLGEVCETTSGGTPSRKNPKYYDGKIPWIKSGELNFNTIRDSEEKITADAIENSNAKILEKGTLLIALYGATVGRLAFLGIEAATNQAVAAIFTPKNLSSKFLYWFLFSYREKLLTQRIGGAQPNISQGTLRNIPIPLPPLAEQKKIVEKIEELFSGLDNGVASLKKAKEQIKLYRQSVLAFAFSGKLVREVSNRRLAVGKSEMLKAAEPKGDYNKSHPVCLWRIISGSEKLKQVPQRNGQLDDNGLPEGWSFIKIRDISDDMMIGIVKSAKEQFTDKRGVPYIKMNNVSMDGTVDVNDVVNVEVNKQEMEKFKLKKGDILFNTRNSYELVGKTGIVKDDKIKRVYNNNLLRIRVKKDFNPDFINYQMNSYYFREKLKAGKRATTNICAIYQTDLFSMELNVPPLNQQHQIVSEIEKRFSEADNLEKAIDDSLAKSELLRQSILSQAFSGKLV